MWASLAVPCRSRHDGNPRQHDRPGFMSFSRVCRSQPGFRRRLLGPLGKLVAKTRPMSRVQDAATLDLDVAIGRHHDSHRPISHQIDGDRAGVVIDGDHRLTLLNFRHCVVTLVYHRFDPTVRGNGETSSYRRLKRLSFLDRYSTDQPWLVGY